MHENHAALFTPIKIGTLPLRNRIIMTALSTRFPGFDGKVTERLLSHYARRAEGGAAMLTVELADAHPYLRHLLQALWNYNNSMIPELRKITGAIHKHGAAASIQVGAYFRTQLTSITHYTASLGSPEAKPGSMELNETEIAWLITVMTEAAWRCKEAGFDAIELHGVHGDIIEEFFSPYWNKRTDKYGGSLENRMRFPLELLRSVRKRLGPDFPVIYRICGSEFHPEGTGVEDAIALTLAARDDGLDAVHLSGGIGHIDHLAIASSYETRGMLLPLARAVREKAGIPVIVANSLTPEQAAAAVADGDADIVGLARPLLVDPDWPAKMAQGEAASIRPCIRCNQGCIGGLREPGKGHISCLANPQAGEEYQGPPPKTDAPKKIAVIGGGVAGCETALVAAQRGHAVTLFEQKETLGGQFNAGSRPPGKSDFTALLRFFERALPEAGISVCLNTKATKELLGQGQFDCAVLATGATPLMPPIPGLDLPHVHKATDVLLETVTIPAGDAVTVLGAGATGLETAHFLAEKGHAVTVVDLLHEPGRDMVHGVGVRERLLGLLHKGGVPLRMGLRVLAVEKGRVIAGERLLSDEGNRHTIATDSVVVAWGARPLQAMEDELRDAGLPLFPVGDCHTPGNAWAAMRAGYALGMTL